MYRFSIKSKLFKGVSGFLIILFLITLSGLLFAQDDEVHKAVTIKLSFTEEDSIKTCSALVMEDTMPVKEIEVKFYVKRLFSLLPIGKGSETDESGSASVEFPSDLPGDKDGNLEVVAKIEDDESYGTVEVYENVKWGIRPSPEHNEWGNRSLSASREKAPTYLIIASNLIIAVIWGTIFYVFIQIFRIRKKGLSTK